MEVSQEELQDFSKACQKLWDLDTNRLEPGVDYDVNVQEGKKSYEMADVAGEHFFTRVNKAVWQKPTFLIFYHLLDNYERETGVSEVADETEKKEMTDFLDAVMETQPMKYCHQYLVAQGKADPDLIAFKRQLYQMWFALYRRDGQADSSGFEHVFVGESDGDKVSGLHNWVQVWVEEKRGNLDYRGYLVPRQRGGGTVDHTDRVLSVQLSWHGEMKGVTTLLVGTSPEFELALYSMAFMQGEERVYATLANYDVVIRCYRIHSKYGDKVGSTFLELLGERE